MYDNENDQLFIYGSRCEQNEHFWICGGPWQCLGEDFDNRIGPISVRIHHLIYVNLHVKYGRNLIRTLLINHKYEKHDMLSYFVGPGWGPYVESRGTKMPINVDLIILETYGQQGK